MQNSDAYRLGFATSQKQASYRGVLHLLRRFGRGAATGFGRKRNAMRAAAGVSSDAAGRAAYKLHRRGGLAHDAGAFAAEYPNAALVGGGYGAFDIVSRLIDALKRKSLSRRIGDVEQGLADKEQV